MPSSPLQGFCRNHLRPAADQVQSLQIMHCTPPPGRGTTVCSPTRSHSPWLLPLLAYLALARGGSRAPKCLNAHATDADATVIVSTAMDSMKSMRCDVP